LGFVTMAVWHVANLVVTLCVYESRSDKYSSDQGCMRVEAMNFNSSLYNTFCIFHFSQCCWASFWLWHWYPNQTVYPLHWVSWHPPFAGLASNSLLVLPLKTAYTFSNFRPCHKWIQHTDLLANWGVL